MNKLFWLVLLLFSVTFSTFQKAEASEGSFVEIGQLARSQGIDTNKLFTDPPFTCYAPKAERKWFSEIIQYEKAVFLLVTQLGNRGKLYVSSNTKCSQEYWDTTKYKPGIWQSFGYYNHEPNQFRGGVWNSQIRTGDRSKTPFCRAKEVNVYVSRGWSSPLFEHIQYTKVVLYVPTDAWFGLTREFDPAASFWYISKDVSCFKTRLLAERGGYRFLNK